MTDDTSPANIIRFPNPEALARGAAEWISERAEEAISEAGTFTLALSGGSTPKTLFQTLASTTYRNRIQWSSVQVFFSDERFVPLSSPDSNFYMANEALLSKVPIPPENVHPVQTEGISAVQSAKEYESVVREIVPPSPDGIPRFDVVLLGLGPDGHTASLFPDSDALGVTDRLVAANYVEKLHMWRVTFTYPLLNSAHRIAFLVEGDAKAEKVRQVIEGDIQLPASGVRPATGELIFLADEAALAMVRPINESR